MNTEEIRRISKLLAGEHLKQLSSQADISVESLLYVAERLSAQILSDMTDWNGMGYTGSFTIYPLWNVEEKRIEWRGLIDSDIRGTSYRHMRRSDDMESESFDTFRGVLIWIVVELYLTKKEGFDW